MATNEPQEKSGGKRTGHASRILAKPMQQDGLRICPNCGKWFAMIFVSTRKDELSGRIDLYRCKQCGRETEYAERHPPGVV